MTYIAPMCLLRIALTFWRCDGG